MSNLLKIKDDDILFSYIIINTNFEFYKSVKYPLIPFFMDKTTTVYPLKVRLY